MRRVAGQITGRLITALGPDDPAWWPPRDATSPVAARTPSAGWHVTDPRGCGCMKSADIPEPADP
jgi:hypothetical protein